LSEVLNIDGTILKDLRMKKKLSMQQVAEVVGCSAAYINNLEKGHKKNPGYLILVKLAELFGVNVDDLAVNNKVEAEIVKLDLIKELYRSDILLYEGKEIPIQDEKMISRIEMGIRMGIAWATQPEQDNNE
jgi:transcriptional regulator with XRE-family HTH domain